MSASMSQLVFRLETVKFRQKKLIWKHFETLGDGLNNRDSYEPSARTISSGDISCIPIIIEFRRLLGLVSSTSSNKSAIPGVCNKELLHAVVGLYDVCLPDITPEVLYNTVCGKYAKTIILVRENSELLNDLTERTKRRCKQEPTDTKGQANDLNTDFKSSDPTCTSNDKEYTPEDGMLGDEPVLKPEFEGEDSLDVEERPGTFDDVFSDTDEEEDEEDSSSSEDEDYSTGLKTFLKLVHERREKRQKACRKGEAIAKDSVGIESKIVACATWKKSHICPGEKIIQICLMGVRKKCRKCGIGKYLIKMLKDTTLVGIYDSLVVYADPGAVDFFKSFGFKDDIVLNSKYEQLVDNWTNSTMMCYLPPFTGHTLMQGNDELLDMDAMELEFEKLTKRSRDFYQTQYHCMERLKHEVLMLRTIVQSQKQSIKSLSFDKELLQKKCYSLEKDCLLLKMRALKSGIDLEPDHFYSGDS
ncbi:uncharacterized protein [Antedon mediterranea]|uniref:uncharacterized protein n=1 Tax=Antedon mediterranea TaxID=105859 RepID=UPI003AF76012